MAQRSKKSPFESEALSSSNTGKSNPFVSLFSGASGVLGTMMGKSASGASLGSTGRNSMMSAEEEDADQQQHSSPTTGNSTTSSAQFNFSPVTGRDSFPTTAWVCSSCGKSKDLTGDHLRNKQEVRSDCWSCGKKRVFQLCGSDGTRLGTGTSRTESPGARGGRKENISPEEGKQQAAQPTVSPKLSFATPPQPPGAFGDSRPKSGRPSATTSGSPYARGKVGQWRCSTCDKTKPLEGDHLRGKTQVRSDCWPCAKKRTFVFHSVEEALPSPASFNLSSAGAGQHLTFPATQERSSSPPNVEPTVDNKSLDATLGASSGEGSVHDATLKLSAARVLLQFNSEYLHSQLPPQVESIRSCNSTVANDTHTFIQVGDKSEKSFGDLAQQIVRALPSRGSSEAEKPLLICCHDETTFAAMTLYVATLQGGSELGASCSIRVFGPAFDKTTREKTKAQQMVDAARTLCGDAIANEVLVSHHQAKEASMPLYESTGWISAGTNGMAISLAVGSGTTGPADRAILCGPSVPYRQLNSHLL